MGSVYKAIAVFERPFRRDCGRAGFLVLDNPAGLCSTDTTAPGGPGHLCAGPEARSLEDMDADTRRHALSGPLGPARAAEAARRLTPAHEPP